MDNIEDLLFEVGEKVQFGESLVKKLIPIQNIDGVTKLQRKIKQEIEFLKKPDLDTILRQQAVKLDNLIDQMSSIMVLLTTLIQRSNRVKSEQLCCSNLRHLGAMVDCSLRPGVIAVCKIFHIDEESKLVVDIISSEGKTWTKVIARNPRSLSTLSSGKASYGARSILDQADDYLTCAKLYPCMYQSPKVIFEFVSGIEETLAKKLRSTGVILKGEILPDSSQDENYEDSYDSSSGDEEISLQSCHTSYQNLSQCIEEHSEIDTLNLDVTAMMAVVSNMTNGYCNYVFRQEVLTQQSSWESDRPVRPILDKLFDGKKLVCCETAWNDFEKIVNTLGGPMEKQRTAALKTQLSILPDDFGGEDDYPRHSLKVRGNVRLRSKIIFNFGHRIKALTVSANEGFVRAAAQQSVTYAAFIHESRALTEGKESTATKISP